MWKNARCAPCVTRPNGTVSGMNNDVVAQSVIDEFESRFERLASIEAGWMDGRGEAVTADASSAARALIREILESNLALPFVYPVEDGGMSLQWWCEDKCRHIAVQVSPAGALVMQHTVEGVEAPAESCDGAAVLAELARHDDLLGHTGSGVKDEEIHMMLECIAVAVEMTNGEAIERAERAGMAFLATWDAPARLRFAGELSVVAIQSMESRTARIFEAFLDAYRPKLETGLVDVERITTLLAE